ncbi:MAG: CDP-diacylglycerol--serine O-phosphatidyltransferase [Culturomica sp.]|jgi:CDP-diacylglycerol--serine O-phosphatidyltransferase|nr:CDP-diacylglycerol--serine O-phosphatidyltransferase [Culturomica sp.]
MKKQIPNLITGLNAVSGALSVFAALYGELWIAALFIVAGMVFDFFDGWTARLLHVKSEMGKELDSLADMVTFGFAPAVLAHFLIRDTLPAGVEIDFYGLLSGRGWLAFIPLLIPFFSAFRLAKFNLDTRQSVTFLGLPVPANALYWVSLVFAVRFLPEIYALYFANIWVLAASVVILSILLVSELPMFSLKIGGWSWRENKLRYTYLGVIIVIALTAGKAVVLCLVPLYILFCAVNALALVIKKI